MTTLTQDDATIAYRQRIDRYFYMTAIAMYSLQKRATSAVAALVLVGIVLGTWSVLKATPSSCYTPPSDFRLLRAAGFWGGLLATDIIFLGLTMYRGYSQFCDGFGLPVGSLWRVLVRDGIIYYMLSRGCTRYFPDCQYPLFSIICSANLSNIGVYYVFGDIDVNGGQATFTVALSVIMVCRLTLNLHETAYRPDGLMALVPEIIQIPPHSTEQEGD
ncbi:hypothetical protein GGX14DRAFT_575120 [Mycena pura]|uniref:Uncharacterized protein n=1 Tax=Mycena pura TaxID=153505 RepID=A0AAD6UWC3_9AGAR|nr:hypothetical protein GGX14DRAFT_575120 [Mycena pura]